MQISQSDFVLIVVSYSIRLFTVPVWLKVFFQYAFNGLFLMPLFILALVYLGYIRGKSKVFETNGKAIKDALRREKDEKKQILQDYNIRL